MIKLIASDMDGTLLNSEGNMNPEFPQVFQDLKNKGIIFAPASGRQYYTLLEMFKDYKDDMVFIAENGTFVVYKGEELFLHPLDMKTVHELVKTGRSIPGVHIVLCGKKGAYFEESFEGLMEQIEKYYKRNFFTEDLLSVEDDILKVTICDFAGAELNTYPHYKKYSNDVQVSLSGHLWLDITAKNANKGEALRKIQEKLGITYDETMAFGDFLNDYEMMQEAYHSYAMENAHEDLKKVSRFVAKSNDDNGVLDVIKKHI